MNRTTWSRRDWSNAGPLSTRQGEKGGKDALHRARIDDAVIVVNTRRSDAEGLRQCGEISSKYHPTVCRNSLRMHLSLASHCVPSVSVHMSPEHDSPRTCCHLTLAPNNLCNHLKVAPVLLKPHKPTLELRRNFRDVPCERNRWWLEGCRCEDTCAAETCHLKWNCHNQR